MKGISKWLSANTERSCCEWDPKLNRMMPKTLLERQEEIQHVLRSQEAIRRKAKIKASDLFKKEEILKKLTDI